MPDWDTYWPLQDAAVDDTTSFHEAVRGGEAQTGSHVGSSLQASDVVAWGERQEKRGAEWEYKHVKVKEVFYQVTIQVFSSSMLSISTRRDIDNQVFLSLYFQILAVTCGRQRLTAAYSNN